MAFSRRRCEKYTIVLLDFLSSLFLVLWHARIIFMFTVLHISNGARVHVCARVLVNQRVRTANYRILS